MLKVRGLRFKAGRIAWVDRQPRELVFTVRRADAFTVDVLWATVVVRDKPRVDPGARAASLTICVGRPSGTWCGAAFLSAWR